MNLYHLRKKTVADWYEFQEIVLAAKNPSQLEWLMPDDTKLTHKDLDGDYVSAYFSGLKDYDVTTVAWESSMRRGTIIMYQMGERK